MVRLTVGAGAPAGFVLRRECRHSNNCLRAYEVRGVCVHSGSFAEEDVLKNLSLAKCVAQRLQVSHQAQGRLTVELGRSGLVCVGVGSHEGIPPLLVVYDEGVGGNSVYADACLGDLLPFLSTNWRGLFPVVGATVTIRTKDDCWDRAVVTWAHQTNLVRGFDLVPIKWFGCAARTEEAFAGAFGIQARRAQHIMFRMRAMNLGSMGT